MTHKKMDTYCSMLLGNIWEVKPSSRKEAQLVLLAGTLSYDYFGMFTLK